MYLNQKKYVRYECTCGTLKTICNLYFCRHCLQLRCGYCLCHEVDSPYCSNCMEHLPASEAKVKKNKCTNCFDCPSCFHTLSVRATTRNPDENSKAPTKHYYLACFFCRWTTRDAGIPDQTIATGNWPIKQNPHQTLLQSFLNYYKVAVLREKMESDKKSYSNPRRSYLSYTEKYGLTSMMARKRAGLPSLPLGAKEKSLANIPGITPCEPTADVPPLPDSFFTQPPDLTKITRLEQRLANPALQPETTDELHPMSRHFYIKRSLRCKECEHTVSKPEYNPSSIKFKIQQAAYHHMPEVRLVTVEPMYAGKSSDIIIKLTNPTRHLTSVQFGSLPTKEEESIAKERKGSIKDTVQGEPKIKAKDDDEIKREEPNTVPVLPNCAIVLPPRDDAAEYDDSSDTHHFQDDPKVVVWRKGNKAEVKFSITPRSDLIGGDETLFGFCLDYGYVNTMPSVEPRPQRVEMSVKIFVRPGFIISNQA